MFYPDFTQVQQFWANWGKMTGMQMTQFEKLTSEMGKVRGESIERAQAVIDESARLMKESLNAANELSMHWQKLGFEFGRQAMQGGVASS